MPEKSKKSGGRRKERGLNVRVLQEAKVTDDSKVRVNNYQKKSRPKKKASKPEEAKTAEKAASEMAGVAGKAEVELGKITEVAENQKAPESAKKTDLTEKKVGKNKKAAAIVGMPIEEGSDESKKGKVRVNTRVKKETKKKAEAKAGAKVGVAEDKVAVEEKKTEAKTKRNEKVQDNKDEKDERVTKDKSEKVADSKEKKEEKPAKAPASFSKSAGEPQEKVGVEILLPEKGKKQESYQIVLPEPKKAEKREEKDKASVKLPKQEKKDEAEVIDSLKQEENSLFETLILNTGDTGKSESKIIPRDVAKPKEEIERAPVIIPAKIPASTEKKSASSSRRRFTPIAPQRPVKQPKKLTAKELKEQEIEKAINTATKLPEVKKKRTRKPILATKFGWARLTLMITCATTAVFSLVYFINLTSTDMSLKVAATQSGIEASYPDYVPRGYELSDVTSASGKVTMNFKSEDSAFMLTEESSSWDSSGLLNNYIRENYTDDSYTVVSEQGLTIYMGNNWEAWVNGGILYKLTVKSGALTKKQLKTIATSL